MKTSLPILVVVSICMLVAAMPAVSASPAQERRSVCRAEAGSRVGADRKEFIASCVIAKKKAAAKKPASEKQITQRAKMRACSEDFKIAGQPKSERRAFISACMKRA